MYFVCSYYVIYTTKCLEFNIILPTGKFSHLDEKTLNQLEEEVRTAAADADRAPHLQEFLDVAQQELGERFHHRIDDFTISRRGANIAL